MCAINPSHKKRFLMDFYTSDKHLTEEEFNKCLMEYVLTLERTVNEFSPYRLHIKETDQEAD